MSVPASPPQIRAPFDARPSIEHRLNRAEWQWRLVRWGTGCTTLGISLAIFALLLGIAMQRDWIVRPWQAATLTVVALAIVVVGGLLATLIVLVQPVRKRWLAQAVEQAQPELVDRLNTAVFVDETLARARASGTDATGLSEEQLAIWKEYNRRVREQARETLATRTSAPATFSYRPLVQRLGLLVLLALAAGWFYQHYRPLQHLQSAAQVAQQKTAAPPSLTIPPPSDEVVEEAKVWGEVRITEPGSDVRMTKLDSLELQIEAAASSPLESVQWYLSRNGEAATEVTLPAPTDPRFAAYRQEINAPALELHDWDTLSYYAKAQTKDGQIYQSATHFVEITPLQSDANTLTQAESDSTERDVWDDLAQLIRDQEELIREGDQLSALPAGSERIASQREDMARRQQDAAAETRRLAAATAALEPTSDASADADRQLRAPDQQLDTAERAMQQAADAWRKGQTDEARVKAQQALARLVGTRQQLAQHSDSQPSASNEAQAPNNATAADQPAERPTDSPQTPNSPENSPENSAEQAISQMQQRAAERQNRAERVAQARQLAQREQQIANRANPADPAPKQPLAQQQEQLNVELEQLLAQENKSGSSPLNPEQAAARNACRETGQALRSGSPESQQYAQRAAQQLNQLADQMQRESEKQDLADAYRTQQMLHREINRLGEMAQNPEQKSVEQFQQEAGAVRELNQQIEKIAANPPAQSKLGESLREQLTPPKQTEREQQCQGMCESPSATGRGSSAGDLRQSLQQMAEAFQQGMPARPSQRGRSQPESERGESQTAESQKGASQKGESQGGESQGGESQGGESQGGESQGGESQQGDEQIQRGLRSLESLARDAQRQGNSQSAEDAQAAGASQPPGSTSKQPGDPANPQRTAAGQSTGNRGMTGDNSAPTSARPLTPSQRQMLRADARHQLQQGILNKYGHNDRSVAVASDVDRRLQDETAPIDASVIESLSRSIQMVRQEESVARDEPESKPAEASFVDPARLPPSYRRPIQSYFQKLSEQR